MSGPAEILPFRRSQPKSATVIDLKSRATVKPERIFVASVINPTTGLMEHAVKQEDASGAVVLDVFDKRSDADSWARLWEMADGGAA